jgi:hypothetical protein
MEACTQDVAGRTRHHQYGFQAMKNSRVIPVKTGIQQLNQPAQRTEASFFLATRENLNQLDSRLRGNDGVA